MGKQPTPSYLRNILNADKAISKKSLIQHYEDFIEGYRLKGAKGTVTKLKTNLKHLQNFGKKQHISIDFDTISAMFLNKYVEYFQVQLQHTNGTIARNIKVFKWFLNWASKYDYNKNYTYKTFNVKYQEPEIIVLSDDELLHLFTMTINNDCLRQIRDIFCFSCFTALRYSDVKNLKKTDINNGFISITSIKTKSQIVVPLIRESKEILSRYVDLPGKNALPVISNQKMNEYLKELGKLAGLNRPITKVKFRGSQRIDSVTPLYEVLTTHIGRKTFISYMFRKGVDSELIRAISNHKSISSFARYNKIDDEHKASAMTVAFKKAI